MNWCILVLYNEIKKYLKLSSSSLLLKSEEEQLNGEINSQNEVVQTSQLFHAVISSNGHKQYHTTLRFHEFAEAELQIGVNRRKIPTAERICLISRREWTERLEGRGNTSLVRNTPDWAYGERRSVEMVMNEIGACFCNFLPDLLEVELTRMWRESESTWRKPGENWGRKKRRRNNHELHASKAWTPKTSSQKWDWTCWLLPTQSPDSVISIEEWAFSAVPKTPDILKVLSYVQHQHQHQHHTPSHPTNPISPPSHTHTKTHTALVIEKQHFQRRSPPSSQMDNSQTQTNLFWLWSSDLCVTRSSNEDCLGRTNGNGFGIWIANCGMMETVCCDQACAIRLLEAKPRHRPLLQLECSRLCWFHFIFYKLFIVLILTLKNTHNISNTLIF